MKRSNIWSRSILIALALLLSAVKSGHPSPSPRPTAKPSEHAQLTKGHSDQQPAPVGAPNLSHAPDGASAPDKHKNQGNDGSTIVIAISAVVSTIATALIAWFNWQLVGVTRDLHTAAEATAKIAELALNAERPFLSVENPTLSYRTVDLPSPYEILLPSSDLRTPIRVQETVVGFTLRNRGMGIAIVDEVNVRPYLARGILGRGNRYEKLPATARTMRLEFARPVMGHVDSGQYYLFVPDNVAPRMFIGSERVFVISGFARYRDVYDRTHRTTFCYLYQPADLRHEGAFYIGPKKNNRYKQED